MLTRRYGRPCKYCPYRFVTRDLSALDVGGPVDTVLLGRAAKRPESAPRRP
ncbi:MAG TPA: hypothetical protein VH008_01405 [Pseudonocardia sp.]|nr:hypothetical protein [Pseudonocardia sp.]